MPLGAGTPNDFLQEAGELDVFCPYREVRAHWIPFAVQVAKLEEQRHRERGAVDGDIHADIENLARAIGRFRRHDPEALVRLDRPMLARIAPHLSPEQKAEITDGFERRYGDDGGGFRPGSSDGWGDLDFEAICAQILTGLAATALQGAETTGNDLARCLAFAKLGRRPFHVARADQNEWEISFAAALGFAWRRLTGKSPSGSPEGPFIRFVEAAYLSLAGNASAGLVSWSRPCLAARPIYRIFFRPGLFPRRFF